MQRKVTHQGSLVLAEVWKGIIYTLKELQPKAELICREEQMPMPSRRQNLRCHLGHHDHLLVGKYVVNGVWSIPLISSIVRRICEKKGHILIYFPILIIEKVTYNLL